MTFGTSEDKGRFAFDQEFWKFLEGERMEQTFSGISFRNFGCTSRGWTKIPEIRRLRVLGSLRSYYGDAEDNVD